MHSPCRSPRGFANHPGAWIPGGEGTVRFFAHDVT